MNSHYEQLNDALRAFNEAERADFTLATNTTWLGLDGPAYWLGDVRAKALFTGTDGEHWVDAMLAVESLAGRNLAPSHLEVYRERATSLDAARDLWVWTETRGKWNAVMVPADTLADAWGYPPPALMPDGDWARTWLDMPERSDGQEISWIAHGGTPLSAYRIGRSL